MSATRTSERGEAPFRTPWGTGTLVVQQGRLVEVNLPVPVGGGPPTVAEYGPANEAANASGDDAASAGDEAAGATGDHTLDRWVREIEAYFSGSRRSWTAEELQLDDLGFGEFRGAVYRALLGVGPGETVGYGELAVLAGYPGAARAVGTAMAQNPLALVIPCHRVVRADGSPGRYGQCDALKPYLLALEGAA